LLDHERFAVIGLSHTAKADDHVPFFHCPSLLLTMQFPYHWLPPQGGFELMA
jgi:hypothetical protein